MFRIHTRLSLILFFLLPVLSSQAMNLVENGQPASVIVVPDNPLPNETFAAEELQKHIHLATGATLDILAETSPEVPDSAKTARIYVGNCKKTRDAGIDVSKLRKCDGVIKTAGGNLFLAGRDDKKFILDKYCNTSFGTLLAVYDFLDRDMGVRWLWPGDLGTYVPKRKSLSVGELSRPVKPRLLCSWWSTRAKESRPLPGWKKQTAKTFARQQRLWLCRQRFCQAESLVHGGHDFRDYWNRFGKTHPEYFALLPNGKRGLLPQRKGKHRPWLAMFCESSPELHQQIVKDHFEKYKGIKPTGYYDSANVLRISENDTPVLCTCKRCRAWDADDPRFAKSDYWGKGVTPPMKDRFPALKSIDGGGADDTAPSLSDRMAKFYLAVQKEARKVNSHAVVWGFAYANYLQPPVNVKLNDRVLITVVNWPPFPMTPERIAEARKIWDGWRKTGARLTSYCNSSNAGHNFPIFYAKRLGELFLYYSRNGMVSAYFNGLTGQWAAQGPSLYTIGRLVQRPDLSVDQILDEYYTAFGPASDAVKKYFEHWEKVSDAWTVEEFRARTSAVGRGASYHNWVNGGGAVCTPEVMQTGRKLLDQALAAAKGDKQATARVRYLEKGFTHAEYTLKALKARHEKDADPTPANVKAFEDALQTLKKYRASIEDDFVSDMGHMYSCERRAGWWPKPPKKRAKDNQKNR